MRRLEQLIQSQIVFIDDVLYFTFKKNSFTGKIAKGGLIWRCTWQKPGEEAKPIFISSSQLDSQPFIRTFESLTDWTETCIQECLDEYHTRYSSWKRVRHERTDQPMEILFKHFLKKNLPKEQTNSNNLLLYEQLAAYTHRIEMLTSSIDKWEAWYKQHHPNTTLPVENVTMPEESKTHVQPHAQPFVLTSDSGQYMVLHRMNEIAPPECVSWLKQNGAGHFKDMLSEMPNIIQFEPTKKGENTNTYYKCTSL